MTQAGETRIRLIPGLSYSASQITQEQWDESETARWIACLPAETDLVLWRGRDAVFHPLSTLAMIVRGALRHAGAVLAGVTVVTVLLAAGFTAGRYSAAQAPHCASPAGVQGQTATVTDGDASSPYTGGDGIICLSGNWQPYHG
jgi:hypothetical protein